MSWSCTVKVAEGTTARGFAAVSLSDGRVTMLDTRGVPRGTPGRGAELISTGGGILRRTSAFPLCPTCIFISVIMSPGSKLELREIPTRRRGGGRFMVRRGGRVLKGVGVVVVVVVVVVGVVVVVVVVWTPHVRSKMRVIMTLKNFR